VLQPPAMSRRKRNYKGESLHILVFILCKPRHGVLLKRYGRFK